ncbi:MAG: hypothetical protein PVI43_06360 [Candidatus Bathyarchaeota archaeon]|jgi:hypothetical protein
MNEKTRELYPQPMPMYAYTPAEDEISLVDIWLSLSRYRKSFFVTAAIILALGTAFSLFVYKERYSLVTTIQIGSVEKDNKIIPLESAESLLSKINSSVSPQYTHQWMRKNGYDKVFKTDISNPKGSDVVTLTNKVKENELKLFTGYQQGLAKLVIDDQRRLIKSLQAKLVANLELAQLELDTLENPLSLEVKLKASEIKLDSEQQKLKKLEDENFFGIQKNEFQNKIVAGQHELDLLKATANSLQAQMKRMEETKDILGKSIDELDRQIKESRSNQRKAQAGATELSAMSQLLIDNEIQQNNNRLLALEERYYVTLENEKTELLNKIEANRLQQIDVEKKNNVLKQKYDQLILDNQLQIEQQNLVIDQARLNVERVKFDHQNLISEKTQRIREIETLLENYNETRVVSEPVASLEPTGLKRNMLLVMVVVLALLGGFFASLLAMFTDKVRQRKQELLEAE